MYCQRWSSWQFVRSSWPPLGTYPGQRDEHFLMIPFLVESLIHILHAESILSASDNQNWSKNDPEKCHFLENFIQNWQFSPPLLSH